MCGDTIQYECLVPILLQFFSCKAFFWTGLDQFLSNLVAAQESMGYMCKSIGFVIQLNMASRWPFCYSFFHVQSNYWNVSWQTSFIVCIYGQCSKTYMCKLICIMIQSNSNLVQGQGHFPTYYAFIICGDCVIDNDLFNMQKWWLDKQSVSYVYHCEFNKLFISV